MYWLGRVVSTRLAISAIMQDDAIGTGVAARRRSQACGCVDRGLALHMSVESASATPTVPMPSPGGVTPCRSWPLCCRWQTGSRSFAWQRLASWPPGDPAACKNPPQRSSYCNAAESTTGCCQHRQPDFESQEWAITFGFPRTDYHLPLRIPDLVTIRRTWGRLPFRLPQDQSCPVLDVVEENAWGRHRLDDFGLLRRSSVTTTNSIVNITSLLAHSPHFVTDASAQMA